MYGRANATSIALTPASAITAGNRLVALVGVWSSGAATAKSVTDAAGNTYGRGAALQCIQEHGAERVDGAAHRRRRDEAEDERDRDSDSDSEG